MCALNYKNIDNCMSMHVYACVCVCVCVCVCARARASSTCVSLIWTSLDQSVGGKGHQAVDQNRSVQNHRAAFSSVRMRNMDLLIS